MGIIHTRRRRRPTSYKIISIFVNLLLLSWIPLDVVNATEIKRIDMDLQPREVMEATNIINVGDRVENLASNTDDWEELNISGLYVGAQIPESILSLSLDPPTDPGIDGILRIYTELNMSHDVIMSGVSEYWVRMPFTYSNASRTNIFTYTMYDTFGVDENLSYSMNRITLFLEGPGFAVTPSIREQWSPSLYDAKKNTTFLSNDRIYQKFFSVIRPAHRYVICIELEYNGSFELALTEEYILDGNGFSVIEYTESSSGDVLGEFRDEIELDLGMSFILTEGMGYGLFASNVSVQSPFVIEIDFNVTDPIIGRFPYIKIPFISQGDIFVGAVQLRGWNDGTMVYNWGSGVDIHYEDLMEFVATDAITTDIDWFRLTIEVAIDDLRILSYDNFNWLPDNGSAWNGDEHWTVRAQDGFRSYWNRPFLDVTFVTTVDINSDNVKVNYYDEPLRFDERKIFGFSVMSVISSSGPEARVSSQSDYSSLKGAIAGVANLVYDGASAIKGWIESGFTWLFEQLQNLGEWIINSLISFLDWVMDIFEQIIDVVSPVLFMAVQIVVGMAFLLVANLAMYGEVQMEEIIKGRLT